MPGFVIPKSEDDREGISLLLFYDDTDPISLIQQVAVNQMDVDINVETILSSENPGKIANREVRMVPTTILLDGEKEIYRWEGPTHKSKIIPEIKEIRT